MITAFGIDLLISLHIAWMCALSVPSFSEPGVSGGWHEQQQQHLFASEDGLPEEHQLNNAGHPLN